jgi:hypothetical protein
VLSANARVEVACLSGWDVFTLKYEVEEPIATVLDSTAMKSYLRVFKLLWALKRAEHSLNVSWVDLNSVQRQLETFGRYIKTYGMQAYSKHSRSSTANCCLHSTVKAAICALQTICIEKRHADVYKCATHVQNNTSYLQVWRVYGRT